MEEFPLFRAAARSIRPIRSCSSLTCVISSAICSSRAAHDAQPGTGGGISDTSHDHAEPAGCKQHDTPGNPDITRRPQSRTVRKSVPAAEVLNVYGRAWLPGGSSIPRAMAAVRANSG